MEKGDIIAWEPHMHHCGCNGGMTPKVTMNITGYQIQIVYTIQTKKFFYLVMLNLSQFIMVIMQLLHFQIMVKSYRLLAKIFQIKKPQDSQTLNYTLNKYLNGNFEVDKIILVDNFGLDAKYLYKNNYQNSNKFLFILK